MRWLGGGDVKLAAAAAAAFGYPDAVAFVLYTSIGGGLLAIVIALVHGRLGATAANVAQMVQPMMIGRTVAALTPARRLMLPYAVAIAFGAVAVALSHSVLPFLRLTL